MSSVRRTVVRILSVMVPVIVFCPLVLLYRDIGGDLLGDCFRWEFSTPVDREKTAGPTDLVVALVFVCKPAAGPAVLRGILDETADFAGAHGDSDGRDLRLTFAYDARSSDTASLAVLDQYCSSGLGEIECIVPGDFRDREGFREEMIRILGMFHSHGWARTVDCRVQFAVMHNQCESRLTSCDLRRRIGVLRELGCYLDLTLPDVRSCDQPSRVNSICRIPSASRNPYAEAVELRAGHIGQGWLLLINGPLVVDWTDWRTGYRPYVESGRLTPADLPDRRRVQSWIRARMHVTGQPNWVFIKLAVDDVEDVEAARAVWSALDDALAFLEGSCRDREMCRLHYVTAREMFNIARAAEAERTGDAGRFRDHLVEPYIAAARTEQQGGL